MNCNKSEQMAGLQLGTVKSANLLSIEEDSKFKWNRIFDVILLQTKIFGDESNQK